MPASNQLSQPCRFLLIELVVIGSAISHIDGCLYVYLTSFQDSALHFRELFLGKQAQNPHNPGAPGGRRESAHKLQRCGDNRFVSHLYLPSKNRTGGVEDFHPKSPPVPHDAMLSN